MVNIVRPVILLVFIVKLFHPVSGRSLQYDCVGWVVSCLLISVVVVCIVRPIG